MSDTNMCIQSIDNAINKVKEAKDYLKQKEYKNAENSIVDNIEFIIDALNCITGNGQYCQCDNTGAIQIVNIIGTDGAPAGTANLQRGNKYLTNNGAIITWTGDTITVCEFGTPPDIWSIYETPFSIKDSAGIIQTVPVPNAMFSLFDGTKLLVGCNEVGIIIKGRALIQGTPVTLMTIQGYDPYQTEAYNNSGLSKEPAGLLSDIMEQNGG